MLLEVLGALSATVAAPADATPTAAFTFAMPTLVADLVLLAIAVGAVSANAINIYSGTMSFLALGFRLSLALRRAIVAVVFGVLGFLAALSSLDDPSRYENFLLVIAYWIGPWLGVVFADWYLRRGHRVEGFLFDTRHNPWAGWVAMLVAGAVSILLFSNQQQFVGYLARRNADLGDLAFEVGFLLAAALYVVGFLVQRDRTDEELVVRTTHEPRCQGRRKVTSRVSPSAVTVVRAGTVRATITPSRSTRNRGVTRRRASSGGRGVEDDEMAGPPTRRPSSSRPSARAGFVVIISSRYGSSAAPLMCAEVRQHEGGLRGVRVAERVPGVHHRVVADGDVDARGDQLLDPGVPAPHRAGVEAALEHGVVQRVGHHVQAGPGDVRDQAARVGLVVGVHGRGVAGRDPAGHPAA